MKCKGNRHWGKKDKGHVPCSRQIWDVAVSCSRLRLVLSLECIVCNVGIVMSMLEGCGSKRNIADNCFSLLTALPLQAPNETWLQLLLLERFISSRVN